MWPRNKGKMHHPHLTEEALLIGCGLGPGKIFSITFCSSRSFFLEGFHHSLSVKLHAFGYFKARDLATSLKHILLLLLPEKFITKGPSLSICLQQTHGLKEIQGKRTSSHMYRLSTSQGQMHSCLHGAAGPGCSYRQGSYHHLLFPLHWP